MIRFQPILNCENNFLDCKRGVTYEELACDPVLLANTPRVEHNIEDYLTGHYAPAGFNSFPYTNGNWYREHPSFVNSRFADLQGFPFLSYNNLERIRPWQIRPSVYDDIFQTGGTGISEEFACQRPEGVYLGRRYGSERIDGLS